MLKGVEVGVPVVLALDPRLPVILLYGSRYSVCILILERLFMIFAHLLDSLWRVGQS